MELTEPEMAYLRRFSSETANNIFGPGSIFKACWGYIDDLVFLSIPKAQWEIDWDSFPIPLTPEVPFPWTSLEALHQRADEARKEAQQREKTIIHPAES